MNLRINCYNFKDSGDKKESNLRNINLSARKSDQRLGKALHNMKVSWYIQKAVGKMEIWHTPEGLENPVMENSWALQQARKIQKGPCLQMVEHSDCYAPMVKLELDGFLDTEEGAADWEEEHLGKSLLMEGHTEVAGTQ
jgi:hypothetical protein